MKWTTDIDPDRGQAALLGFEVCASCLRKPVLHIYLLRNDFTCEYLDKGKNLRKT